MTAFFTVFGCFGLMVCAKDVLADTVDFTTYLNLFGVFGWFYWAHYFHLRQIKKILSGGEGK